METPNILWSRIGSTYLSQKERAAVVLKMTKSWFWLKFSLMKDISTLKA